MVSRLAKWQVLVSLTVFIMAIVIGTVNGDWGSTYHFSGDNNILAIIILVLIITMVVLGIMQIVYGIGEGSVLSIVAGIFGFLGAYAWLALAAFIINIILWFRIAK